MNDEYKITDTILVSFTCDDDIPVLIVGRKRMNQSVEIINSFMGDDAKQLYSKLITIIPREVNINGE